MKKIIQILPGILITVVIFTIPVLALAQNSQVQTGLGSISNSFNGSGLARETTAVGLIRSVINLMLMFAGIIAVFFLIIGGFWYITSAGNEEQAEKGKGTLINAIIGIVIIVLSYVIVNVVSNLVSGRPT